jgi:hypothetical protein
VPHLVRARSVVAPKELVSLRPDKIGRNVAQYRLYRLNCLCGLCGFPRFNLLELRLLGFVILLQLLGALLVLPLGRDLGPVVNVLSVAIDVEGSIVSAIISAGYVMTVACGRHHESQQIHSSGCRNRRNETNVR